MSVLGGISGSLLTNYGLDRLAIPNILPRTTVNSCDRFVRLNSPRAKSPGQPGRENEFLTAPRILEIKFSSTD
jgi:hypothetical protein